MLMTTIHFNGNCDDAIGFYKGAVGARVKVINYAKDAPPEFAAENPEMPPNFVMYSEISMFGTFVVMSDGATEPLSVTEGNFNLMVTVETPEEVQELFDKLKTGGKASVPPAPQFWATMYAVVTDKFGLTWQITTPD
ncbi:MAG: VOC family protein [Defluviitaleaceae bacterium]|nr:VOC family protein [Defluviitaleaceae bacterium]